jgi:hypothetical protein
MTAYTKEERWNIYRLTKRARGGLYKAEKQALDFIGEAQTMQEGVCRKALKSCEDSGFGVREIQWGIHGKRRNGKLEFPGLIARGIVSASGYTKGGRAPGGKGLAVTYTINQDVLLTFIPETDDDDPPTEKDETLGETKGETSSKKGETYPDLIHTSSSSSSLGSSPSPARQHGENSVPSPSAGEESFDLVDTQTRNLVVVAARSKPNSKTRAEKIDTVSPEDSCDQIIADSQARRLERKASDNEIYREYRKVFDRLEQEYRAYGEAPRESRDALPCGAHFDTPFHPTEKHKHAAAELYRALGRDAVLAKWENFLVNEDHTTITRKDIFDDESGASTGKSYPDEVERAWLLNDFVADYDPGPN